MPNDSNRSVLPLLLGAFAAGAVAGAVTALLLAPRSGAATRQLIGQKTRDLKIAADEALERGSHLMGEVKQKAREVFDKGKDAVREIGDAASRSA